MLAPDKNYINSRFKLPDTNIIVIQNGKHQPELSDEISTPMFQKQSLKIPENTKIEKPFHLLFINSQSCDITLNIVAEKNSSATIIEEHISLGDKPCISNIQINITTKENSEITHYKLQTENITKSEHRAKTVINQLKNSKFHGMIISKGAKTSKDFLHVSLDEQNATFDIKGISTLCDTQNTKQHILIEHKAPNCSSNVLFKGILDDQSTDTFDCLVKAHPEAIKTETHVTNKNLLLSESATVNTSPELEIYVDDVICTHGATVGQLDLDALFYLRSRGIAKAAAEKLLTAAFVQEITQQFPKYERFNFLTAPGVRTPGLPKREELRISPLGNPPIALSRGKPHGINLNITESNHG